LLSLLYFTAEISYSRHNCSKKRLACLGFADCMRILRNRIYRLCSR